MTGWHGGWRGGGALAAAVLAAAPSLAQSDASDSADPVGLVRFPGAWIVAYSPETSLRSYEFITGEVARIRREVRIDRSVRTTAKLVRVTYRTPNGTRLDDVIEHYEGVVRDLAGRVEFTCRGQDCGHSTIWANQVFGVKELAAPDAAQFYLATTIDGSAVGLQEPGSALVSVYVVQRPNRRVNAHIDFAIVAAQSSGGPGDIVQSLNRNGFAVVDAAVPSATGELDANVLQALDDLAAALSPWSGRIAVVCHLGRPGSTAQAEACAELAASNLAAAGVEATAFGAGPFLPREGVPPDRLELVIPGAKQAR